MSAPEGGGMTSAGTGAKIADSNIALYGSKEHKDAKLNAAKSELAWQAAGKEVGTQIWRIEKFEVKSWPKEKYGKFFSGDAYIVLNTYKLPDSDAMRYNVHFWLGAESSQDEQGTAAYKTVELDDLLGDVPVQFREVQGYEGPEFMALFDNKIVTMEGGVASGFNQVKAKEYRPRLLHMKGKKVVRVTEVEMKVGSLNQGDVFLMDCGLDIYQWNGMQSGMHERQKAVTVYHAIQNDRNGKCKIQVIDGLDKTEKKFWELLGQPGGQCPEESQLSPVTEDTEVKQVYEKKLFQLSDAGGNLTMTQVEGKVMKNKLDSKDVFILDVGEAVYAWIGKHASKRERANGIRSGVNYLTSAGRPASTPVVRVTQGREPDVFLDAFEG